MIPTMSARSTLSRLAVRTLSTEASTAASHKPALQLHGIPARYANAIYVAASKAGKLDVVEAELSSLNATVAKSKAFAQFLENPMISRETKTQYVQQLDQLSPMTRQLLMTMAGNARLNLLSKVATTFAQFMKAKRGEVEAKIISAEPLSAAQMKEVQAAMASQLPAGKSVIIQAVTDPSIIGGLQVQIGNQFLDLSVKSRIEEIARTPLT
jgi:F-type H+-transporting ATPase subunit O